MKHIRQILLDNTAFIRISVAASKGDPEELALAKSRFENLTVDEVTFLNVAEVGVDTDRFIGKIVLTGRDGYEFLQRWVPGDTVPVFKDPDIIKVDTAEDLMKIIVPGKYFVKGVNEICLVVTQTMSVDEIQKLLGYTFEPGELKVVLNHLSVNCPIVKGSLPLHKVTVKPDGTVTDGANLTTEPSFEVGGSFIANPHAAPQYITVTRTSHTPVFNSELDNVFKATFVGSYREGDVIQGNLVGEAYRVELDLAHAHGQELKMLTSAGLVSDRMTDVYQIEYINENWTFAEFTPSTLMRVGHPFHISGAVRGDLTNTPWGVEGSEPKIVIEEVGELPVEYAFDINGSFDITHQPRVDGQMTVKFICGLPTDVNAFIENYQILAELTVDDLEFNTLTADATDVSTGNLVTFQTALLSSDDLTIEGTEVEVLIDDVVEGNVAADANGALVYEHRFGNPSPTRIAVAVKMRLGLKETNVVNINVIPAGQTPTEYSFATSDLEHVCGDDAVIVFQILDQYGDPIADLQGTWQREDRDPIAWVVNGTDYTVTLPSPSSNRNRIEYVDLSTPGLVGRMRVSWLENPLASIWIDPTSSTRVVIGQTGTIKLETRDAKGRPLADADVVWAIDDVPQTDEYSDYEGKVNIEVSSATAGTVQYSFGDGVDVPKVTHDVVYEEAAPVVAKAAPAPKAKAAPKTTSKKK